MAFQGDSIYWVEVEKVVPNPFQPRREFDQHKLQELADSIRMYGVLQPLTVTRNEIHRDDGTFYSEYELIAGERRLRASKLAGVAQVPVIIRDGEQNEQEKLELAIIENLQREDLNAVDRALAFQQLADVFKLSHTQVAQKMGRSREYVSNSIRLLALPEHVLTSLKRGELSEGHARTLLMLTDRPEEQEVIFREILLKKLSVREVERIVRKIATDKVRKKSDSDIDVHLIEFEKQFTETLGTRVQIQKTDFGGKLTIDYFSNDDLEIILKRMRDEGSGAKVFSPEDMAKRISEHTPLVIAEDDSFVDEESTEQDFSNESNQNRPHSEHVVNEVEEQPQPIAVAPFQPERTEFSYNSPTEVKPPVSHSPLPTQNVENNSPLPMPVLVPEKNEATWYKQQFASEESKEVTPEVEEEKPPSIPQNIPTQPQPPAQQSPWIARANNYGQNQNTYQNSPPVQQNVPESPVAPIKQRTDSDDSSLYSINNFTV